MKSWLVVSGLLAAVLAVPARAASPVDLWAHGAWWIVQLEQVNMHSMSPRAAWSPSFALRFSVVSRTPQEVRVEVTTVPENRFNEKLVLRYNPKGELISAQIVDPERVETLGSAGGFGVFGMLGREAFVLPKAPPKKKNASLVKIPLDKKGRTTQTWPSGGPWWNVYESSSGLPQRAILVDASWRHPVMPDGKPAKEPPIGGSGSSGQTTPGQGTVTTPPDTVPLGPE
jgi:hypothetical protein